MIILSKEQVIALHEQLIAETRSRYNTTFIVVYLLLFFSFLRYKCAILFAFLGGLKCETIIYSEYPNYLDAPENVAVE